MEHYSNNQYLNNAFQGDWLLSFFKTISCVPMRISFNVNTYYKQQFPLAFDEGELLATVRYEATLQAPNLLLYETYSLYYWEVQSRVGVY